MKIAVYPGTFDPITFGHIDVIKKSLKIFDKLIIATTDNSDKNYFFSLEERIDIINHSLFKDLKFSKKKIKVISFSNLTIELCKKYNASAIIRGLIIPDLIAIAPPIRVKTMVVIQPSAFE